jgi:peptidoglycan/LPS O-acetylase OafA/YrhL
LLFHAPQLASPITATHGYLAVDIFFILSGFVIARTYEMRLLNSQGVAWFLRERLIRLHPLYLVGLAIGIAVAILQSLTVAHHVLPRTTIAAAAGFGLFMIPSWLTDEKLKLFPLDYPAWTLFFEFVVNVVFALTCRWWTKSVLVVATVVSLAVLAFAAMHFGSLDHGALWSDAWCGLARVAYGFPLGALIYKVGAERREFPVWTSPLVLLAVAAVLCAPTTGAFYDMAVIAIAAPVLVIVGSRCTTPNLLKPAYAFIGESSYALYAIHVPLLAIIVPFIKRKVGIGLDIKAGVFVIAAIVLFAWALTRWYDTPMRAWIRRRLVQ